MSTTCDQYIAMCVLFGKYHKKLHINVVASVHITGLSHPWCVNLRCTNYMCFLRDLTLEMLAQYSRKLPEMPYLLHVLVGDRRSS